MRPKDTNSANRQKIILEAFKLFSTKYIKNSTFADIEQATGLSRGGILHYFGTKNKLYTEMMDELILKKNNDIPINPHRDLWENIKEFILYKRKQQEYFSDMGIYNISRAHAYMTINAMNIMENPEEKAALWFEKELSYWKKILTLAQQKGEIMQNVDIDMEARIFLSVFFGNFSISIVTSNGCDLDILQEHFYVLYTQIVNKEREDSNQK